MKREEIESVVLLDLKRANDFFEERVEPKLLERRNIYLSSKDYYVKKFPEVSKKSDFRSFGFYSYVQWAKTPILDSLFGTSRVVHVVGCGPEDEEAARLMEQLIQWEISQQSPGYHVCEQWIEDALVYEFGVLKLWWRRSAEVQEFTEVFPGEQLAQLAGQPEVEIVEVGEPDYFGDVPVRFKREFLLANKPVFDNISPFDMRWSPEAKTLESANFVAQRQFVSASELLSGVEQFGYDKAVVNEVCEGAGGISTTVSDVVLNPELDDLGSEADHARNLIELYECYVNIDVDGDGVLEQMIVTVADNRILRVVPNSFERLPFFPLSVHRDPAKVFPTDISTADISGELQHLVTAMMRQILINTSISNNPRKFVNVHKVDMEDMRSDKVYVRVSDDPGVAIWSEQPTQIAGWTMGLFELFKSYEEEWTGRTRYNQGMQADTLNKTATGITAIMKAGNQRANAITKGFAEDGFKPMLKFLVMLNQRFMDQKQMIRVFSRPLMIMPDDIHGDLDICVETDVGLEKKQQTINALTQYLREVYPFAQQQGLAGSRQFIDACVRALELSGLSNARQYFFTDEDIQQRQEMMALAAVGGAAGAAAAAPNNGGTGAGVPGLVGGVGESAAGERMG